VAKPEPPQASACCSVPTDGPDHTVISPKAGTARPSADAHAPATVFRAGAVVTMDPGAPRAEAVAVLGDRIRAVGSYDDVVAELRAGGVDHTVDDSFANSVMLPGLIEAHCHAAQLGVLWREVYVGAFDRLGPDGRTCKGAPTVRDVVERLREAESKLARPDDALVAWGYDPSMIAGIPSIGHRELDEVSMTRPVLVLNMSGHIGYVNSTVLRLIGYDRTTGVTGVVKDAAGEPTGELLETAALIPVIPYFAVDDAGLDEAMDNAASLALRAGCTTISDLTAGMVPNSFAAMQRAAANPDNPTRLTAYVFSPIYDAMGADTYRQLVASSHDHLRIGGVKFVVDGSIQGFTANLRWPFYYNGAPNGISNVDAATFVQQLSELHAEGIQLSVHANGDAALDVVLDAFTEVLRQNPRVDHRHRLEHVQIADDEALERIAHLGLVPNFFVNHIYFWGDFHASRTLGPVRAARMNPLASARRHGLRFGLHSDSWVTPIDPLHAVWVAATRTTSSGAVLGPDERIGVEDALRAVTIDSAYLLGEETTKGSIERGKLADFAILDREPTDTDVDSIPDIAVQATVLGGRVHAVPAPG
jgi:predicted amidohydrolase YtcJ